ncbi:hypothetical protein Enr13x_03590 [Stieleria neptunia]|uniref:Uncharacterized protein n=1 Tax=Stieleria neptunia TaxID=2527979 RepID=A0A518HIC1_9BACT|nr:hypothetical protein Enr13x_03590 [Stieleria neptunia]
MFGLFGSNPPLTTRQRTELELLMRRIVQRIGESRPFAACSEDIRVNSLTP